jgi:hypothetical protein
MGGPRTTGCRADPSAVSRVQLTMMEKTKTQILFVMGAVTLATFGVLVEGYTYLF